MTLGGIADVATHPDFRGQGYSTEVLNDCVRTMDENGYHLSMLFTGIHGFYRRVGWEVFPTYSHQFRLRKTQDARGETQDIELFDKDKHLDGVAHVYDEFNFCRTATARRDAKYWANSLRWRYDPRAFFVAREGNEVVAYVRGAWGVESTLHEFGCLPGSEDALRRLVLHFAAQAQVNGAERINATLPREENALSALADVSVSVNVRQSNGMMLRLMGARRFLQSLVPELERRIIATGHVSSFAIGIVCLDESVEIRWNNWSVTVGDLSNPSLVLHIQPVLLLQLLLGIGAPVLASVPMTDKQRRHVEAMANSGEFVYWGVDHF
jgi:hypothetical protein